MSGGSEGGSSKGPIKESQRATRGEEKTNPRWRGKREPEELTSSKQKLWKKPECIITSVLPADPGSCSHSRRQMATKTGESLPGEGEITLGRYNGHLKNKPPRVKRRPHRSTAVREIEKISAWGLTTNQSSLKRGSISCHTKDGAICKGHSKM